MSGFSSWANGVLNKGIEGYIEVEKVKHAAPQPDQASSTPQTPPRQYTASTGADAGVINKANNPDLHVGGMSLNKTVLLSTAAVLVGMSVVGFLR